MELSVSIGFRLRTHATHLTTRLPRFRIAPFCGYLTSPHSGAISPSELNP